MENEKILLGHGSGGQLSHMLIKDMFVSHFENDILKEQGDAAIIEVDGRLLAFTTDSFVVDPVFFPGGNIGKLAICGTVNDLAVSGAKPLYVSCGYIIEEGFDLGLLGEIVASMKAEAEIAGVKIVTGDTKVVEKGSCDKIFINTTGLGVVEEKHRSVASGKTIGVGDKIIINGTIGDHGMTIMGVRSFDSFKTGIQSDCASLNHMIREILQATDQVRFMRDATRGGLATVLAELVQDKPYGLEIDEASVPVKENVRGMCELLGFDPFYVANEGKVLVVVGAEDADRVLEIMQNHADGSEAAIIGEIVAAHPGKGWISTSIGGNRIIDMLAGEQLPRIC